MTIILCIGKYSFITLLKLKINMIIYLVILYNNYVNNALKYLKKNEEQVFFEISTITVDNGHVNTTTECPNINRIQF